ncbi:MAG: aminotransferase class I/II-fold pyridoxal phosphate-dependent enzyme [Acidobacteria bacterium]|nr:aminotransferase class I/II-fold pyridoxal phosphate-dependent enzyme [Acidobacteriota bacterium]MBV9478664.1 aminotransferase class I/II-fold pyridoxal phosphate-dependent enzyme [Acidobacteriota bacterium]
MLIQTYISGTSTVNIAASVESAVAAGRAPSGAQLPPVRTLAAHLGVAPATVAAAYRLLQDRGVVVADGRRGTRVRPAPPISLPAEAPLPPGVRDLAEGNPDLTLLPDLAAAMRRVKVEQRLYSDADLNDPDLLALAREQFRADRVPNEHVSVVSGALDGIERVAREHLRPGDRVAVEDPCFTGVLDLLHAQSLVAVPVPVDDEGMIPGELRRALRSASAVIVTPRAQNPTGAAHSPRRARELRTVLAARRDVLVIEDDHAGPVAGANYITLIDRQRERWAVVRSVSKSLGPDLRVALLASDAQTHARVEGRQTLGIRWVSHLLQRLVVAASRDRTPSRASRVYAERRHALLRALAAHGIAAHGRSGLNVWIPVPEEHTVVQALLHAGWGVKAGERYRLTSPPAIRVTTATLTPRDAQRFADDLARVLAPKRRTTGV